MTEPRFLEAAERTCLLTEVFNSGSNDAAGGHAIQRQRRVLFTAIRHVAVLYAACGQAVIVPSKGRRSLVVTQGTLPLLGSIVEQAECLARQGSCGPGSHGLVSLKLLEVLV